MKKLVLFLAILPLFGCQQPEQQKALRIVVRTAVDFGTIQAQIELAKCGEAPDCPKAEQIQKWLVIGNRFLAYIDQPIPPTDQERVLLGLDIMIAEMQQAGATPEQMLYVQLIKNVAVEMFAN